jgi:radical SAM superfamily enzyme
MSGCLDVMNLPAEQRNKYTQKADITPDCDVDGKEVYQLKSTSKNTSWWYDHRISYIDTTSFVDYRTEYFKDSVKIKVIDRSWVSADLADKRANYWGYWYGHTLTTGHETLAFIPNVVTKVNHKYKKKKLWTTKTLRRMPKKIK